MIRDASIKSAFFNLIKIGAAFFIVMLGGLVLEVLNLGVFYHYGVFLILILFLPISKFESVSISYFFKIKKFIIKFISNLGKLTILFLRKTLNLVLFIIPLSLAGRALFECYTTNVSLSVALFNIFSDYIMAGIFVGSCLVNLVKSIMELTKLNDIFHIFYKIIEKIKLSFIIRADGSDSSASSSKSSSKSSNISSRRSSVSISSSIDIPNAYIGANSPDANLLTYRPEVFRNFYANEGALRMLDTIINNIIRAEYNLVRVAHPLFLGPGGSVMYPFSWISTHNIGNPFNMWFRITSLDHCDEHLLRCIIARLECVRTHILGDEFRRFPLGYFRHFYNIDIRPLDVIDPLLTEARASLQSRFLSVESLKIKPSIDNTNRVSNWSNVVSIAESSTQAALRAREESMRAGFSQLPYSDLSDLNDLNEGRITRSNSPSPLYEGKGKGKEIVKGKGKDV